ncbi:HAMP domain-containing sensor histidine kinase [Mesorhizobium sp. CAU 1741]|uniref:sensor histidine kinase n=1 Tax=Mesorhizobium sp. CAU 1741 TaxID=3140366 RepID=UPI00325B0D12
MRRNLFLKIYLTLLASLVAVALAGAIVVHLSNDEEDRSWHARRDAFLADMLPSDTDPAATRIVLERLGNAFDADISLFDAGGTLRTAVGAPLPFLSPADSASRKHDGQRLMTVELEDGRVLVARLGRGFGPPRTGPFLWLALIAALTAMIAWPVVRHLTRRLERLRRGVDTWGDGDLALRVPVEGSDEVAAVAQSFNLAAERIQTLVTAHRALLANASHELRSPLARLRMAIDLYEQEATDARRREIVRNLAELDDLVEEILLASRLEHVTELQYSDPVDLLALTAEEATQYDIAVSGDAVTVKGDARLLSRLARNLIQNAVRHGAMPVTATVTQVGQMVELRICDRGPGIPAAEGERVFEPFYRPSGHGEGHGGWGLGLALVRQIAIHHGGGVRYETATGGGACFIVSLPTK